jgi:hypothetical protein
VSSGEISGTNFIPVKARDSVRALYTLRHSANTDSRRLLTLHTFDQLFFLCTTFSSTLSINFSFFVLLSLPLVLFNYLVCLFPQSKLASDLHLGGANFESWLPHGLSWLTFLQVFLSSFRYILGKYILTVSFHVLSSALIIIIQSFDDIQSSMPSSKKLQSKTFLFLLSLSSIFSFWSHGNMEFLDWLLNPGAEVCINK